MLINAQFNHLLKYEGMPSRRKILAKLYHKKDTANKESAQKELCRKYESMRF